MGGDGGPGLLELAQAGFGWHVGIGERLQDLCEGRWLIGAEALEPGALTEVDVAQGGQDAGVGGVQVAIELLRGERGTGGENLAVGPGAVVDQEKKHLF